ncbi:hypothetical protein [Streptomyces werraensis]|uniref:hypothetical protein n=1 Tax=Streptomyces werraensis TaxID=68284 RepID=UPI0033BF9547|nr:hypothetical protein [Streptomyces werraensis]
MRGCRRGARRGTLHLTVVALVSGKEHGTADWAATERVAPTVVGAALALVACALTDRAAARRRRLTPPGR